MQILLFSILACKVKQNAPRCHTYLEIINARYGRLAHKIFLGFAFVSPINIKKILDLILTHIGHKHPCWQPAATRRQRCRHCLDWNERLCCYLSHSRW